MFGETAGKAFWQLDLGDRNEQSPSLGTSKKRAEASCPKAALGTGSHFLVPGEGEAGRGRKTEAPGAAFLARVRAPTLGPETGTGESPCWDRPRNAVLLPESSGPPPLKATPACSGLPDLFLLRMMTATQLRGDSQRPCWALEKLRPKRRHGPALGGLSVGSGDWPGCRAVCEEVRQAQNVCLTSTGK